MNTTQLLIVMLEHVLPCTPIPPHCLHATPEPIGTFARHLSPVAIFQVDTHFYWFEQLETRHPQMPFIELKRLESQSTSPGHAASSSSVESR
jgi:hypothetical protein